MKINYQGKQAKIAFALGPTNEGTGVSIRVYSESFDADGNPTQQTLKSKVFTTETCGEIGLKFVDDFKALVQPLLDSEI